MKTLAGVLLVVCYAGMGYCAFMALSLLIGGVCR